MKRRFLFALSALILACMAALPASAHHGGSDSLEEGHYFTTDNQEVLIRFASDAYYVGESIDCEVRRLDGDHAVDPSYELSSSDPTVATYQDHVVRFLKAGSVTITARAAGKPDVIAPLNVTAPPREIVFELESIELESDATANIAYHVLPEDASQRVSWHSMDEEAVYVEEGTVRALKSGTSTVVKAITPNGKEAQIVVTVNKSASESMRDVLTAAFEVQEIIIVAVLAALTVGGCAYGLFRGIKRKKHASRL